MHASIFLVLILALKGTTDFKEKTLTCASQNYTYIVEGKPEVYIVADSVDYVTKFKTLDDLDKEIDKQCSRK